MSASNPLDEFRKKASFNSDKLKVYLNGEEIIQYENALYDRLKNEHSFKPSNAPESFKEVRYRTFQQGKAYMSLKTAKEHLKENTRKQLSSVKILNLINPSIVPKQSFIFLNHLKNTCTERHKKLLEDCFENKATGCFCMTEVAHGSNTKAFGTTAIYNKERKVFVINTPNFESAKCWSGGLGQSATHAAVFANLIIDNKNYGLQSFIVPIRDVNSHLPFTGVIVGDMGEKIGLNGADNGFLMLQNYEVPRENLLNKFCDVNENGEFVTNIKDPQIQLIKTMVGVSLGRIRIVGICEALGAKALTIAIRYAAVRRQFGPENEAEVALLEYQTHQYRLFPYLAAMFIFKNISSFLTDVQEDIDFYSKSRYCNIPLASELHAISCAAKALTSWTMRDAIQNCREACGGHGYLKATGLDDIRKDLDSILTFEGENYVILQQTGNFLIKLWPLISKNKNISSPLESVNFLTNADTILRKSRLAIRSLKELLDPNYILYIYDWLVAYLLKTSAQKQEKNSKITSKFWAQADNQIFQAKDLGIAYIERFFLLKFRKLVDNAPDDGIRAVLNDIFYLYALWCLNNHLPFLYQGGFAQNRLVGMLFKEGILKILKKLKNNSVALIDAVAPPDFVLNSILGNSDGQVYKHLQASFLQFPNGLSRPKWWKEILNTQNSKL